MKQLRVLTTAFLIFSACFYTGNSEARIGGGRSSGFRGSRGFGTSQRNSYSRPPSNYQNGQQTSSAPMSGGNPMLRGLMGGLAGGFIGSMLFRSMGHAGDGQTSSGFGLLEFILLGALGFFVFRFFAQRKTASYNSSQNAPSFNSEEDQALVLQRSDPAFNLKTFKEQRMDDFLRIQSAWNGRDLGPVSSIITADFQSTLNSDIESLKRSLRINRLENIAIRGAHLVESWQEPGKEYATLKFQAQLLDFTIDENTQAVVEGDRTQPVKFEEEWTFVRSSGDSSFTNNAWALTAISNA